MPTVKIGASVLWHAKYLVFQLAEVVASRPRFPAIIDGCRLDHNLRALMAAQRFWSMGCEEFDIARSPQTHEVDS